MTSANNAEKQKGTISEVQRKEIADAAIAKYKENTIALTEKEFNDLEAKAVAEYKVEQAKRKPVAVDISDNVQLKTRLAAMNQDQLIKFGEDEFSLKIEPTLTNKVIIENLLRLDGIRRSNAVRVNEESLVKSISADDPPIRVRFFNLQSPTEVINFSFAGPKGMRGPINKTGHQKCPKYELYPSEEYTLPLSVKEHLESLTFTHYKTIIDPLTGQVAGNISTLKPKYILNPIISKEQLLALQTKTQ